MFSIEFKAMLFPVLLVVLIIVMEWRPIVMLWPFKLWFKSPYEAPGPEEKRNFDDLDALLYYAIAHAMAGIDAADKRHCEIAVTNVKKAIRDNQSLLFPNRLNFEEWLRTICFQKPTIEAYNLAKMAWEASRKN